ncbi:MAG TPA: glycosyltransferase [Magnetospirillaceae bacterium]|jgi:hopene-associated glycosyltransferase HpnB
MIGDGLAWIALAAWAWLLLFRGRFWLIEKTVPAPEPAQWPAVTAIIPARDEAETIGEVVRSLRAQDYPGALHILVVDDQSRDGTGEIARAAGATVIVGTPLPAGWVGKLWALEQGVRLAQESHPDADLLLFTDADIRHAPELRRMVARLIAERLDLASLMVRLATTSLAEQAIIPAFVYFFRLLYPFRWSNDRLSKTAAGAGGYMLLRRDALARIGGLATIKGALIDDCTLAAAIKTSGGAIRLDLADETESLRPYGWDGLWRMIVRSAYTQLRHSPLLLAGTVIGLSLGFLVPPVMTIVSGLSCAPAWCAWLLMALSYLPMLRFYRRSPLWAPALPLVALFYLGATIDSARRHWRGRGGEWKGRVQAPGSAA